MITHDSEVKFFLTSKIGLRLFRFGHSESESFLGFFFFFNTLYMIIIKSTNYKAFIKFNIRYITL